MNRFELLAHLTKMIGTIQKEQSPDAPLAELMRAKDFKELLEALENHKQFWSYFFRSPESFPNSENVENASKEFTEHELRQFRLMKEDAASKQQEVASKQPKGIILDLSKSPESPESPESRKKPTPSRRPVAEQVKIPNTIKELKIPELDISSKEKELLSYLLRTKNVEKKFHYKFVTENNKNDLLLQQQVFSELKEKVRNRIATLLQYKDSTNSKFNKDTYKDDRKKLEEFIKKLDKTIERNTEVLEKITSVLNKVYPIVESIKDEKVANIKGFQDPDGNISMTLRAEDEETTGEEEIIPNPNKDLTIAMGEEESNSEESAFIERGKTQVFDIDYPDAKASSRFIQKRNHYLIPTYSGDTQKPRPVTIKIEKFAHAKEDVDMEELTRAQIDTAMVVASQFLANLDFPPSEQYPVVVSKGSPIELKYTVTAFMLLGVDPKFIKTNKLRFDPLKQAGTFSKFANNPVYNNVFKKHLDIVETRKKDFEEIMEKKSKAKEVSTNFTKMFKDKSAELQKETQQNLDQGPRAKG